MSKVRIRKETGNLYLDFQYRGIRCREQTSLKDSPSNRKRVETLLSKVEAMILLDNFDYAVTFPGSKNIAKVSSQTPLYVTTRQNENHIKSVTPIFCDYAENWFELKKIEWRASHQINLKSILDNSLCAYFGKQPIGEVTKSDILNFRAQLAKKKGRNQSGKLSGKTINNHMQLLRTLLSDAADEHEFTSPYRKIKAIKTPKTHIQPFTLEEVETILTSVRVDYKNYYSVRFYTGLRTGEIDGLKWKHVDFERRQILVRETIVNGKVEYTKTDYSQREVPMLGPVFDALKAQQKSTSRISKYVFCNSEGFPLDHNNVTTRVWYPLLRNLGFEKRRPYQSRHTTATLLLASGENPEWIARLLGHSSTEMLFKVYSRYVPNLTRQDGSAFETVIKQKLTPQTGD